MRYQPKAMAPKINKRTQAAARKWVAALRSGKYHQGQGGYFFYSDDLFGPEHSKHCCLAVADHALIGGVALDECPTNRKAPFSEPAGSNGEIYEFGSAEMHKKLGINIRLAEYLAHHNDGNEGLKKKSYSWIARRIEKLWELK